MSGEKDTYVRVRRSERDRMLNACRRQDNLEQNINTRLQQLSSGLNANLADRLSKVNQRQAAYSRQLEGMHNEIRRVERVQQEKLQRQSRMYQQAILSLGSEMQRQRREYIDMIEEQGQRLSLAIEEQRRHLQSQISSIQEIMRRKEINEQTQAEQWLNDTADLLDFVGREYRHEKFMPGAHSKLLAEMEMNRANAAQGNFQAAIASAQQSFLRASELRLELEQLDMEWNSYLDAAKKSAAEALAACEAQEAARFTFSTDQGSEEIAGEIDYWTEGGLSLQRQQVEKELQRLDASDGLTLDDIKESIATTEKLQQHSVELAEQAKEALIASQLRNNIGQTIEEALTQAGWEVTDATYKGEDYRDAVHIKLENPAGDELVTIITPETDEKDTITNRVNISFFDRSTNDEQFRQARLQSILGMLSEDGLECSEPQCKPGLENMPARDESKLDFARVRQAETLTGNKNNG